MTNSREATSPGQSGIELPDDAWIPVNRAFGLLASGDHLAALKARASLQSDVDKRKALTAEELRQAPDISAGTLAMIEALGRRCDWIVARLQAEDLCAYVEAADGLELKAVPSRYFSQGITINVFDGRIARLNDDPDRGREAYAKLKSVGLIGSVWLKRDELAALLERLRATDSVYPSVAGGASAHGMLTREAFEGARDKLPLMVVWAKDRYAQDQIPSRDHILTDHRKIYGKIQGISEPLIRDLLTEIAPGRRGGAPAHRNNQAPSSK